MKNCHLILFALALSYTSAPAAAQNSDIESKIVAILSEQLSVAGSDEGSLDRCTGREPLTKACITRNRMHYRTNPTSLKASVVQATEMEGKIFAIGSLAFDYTCRVRKETYNLDILTNTADSHVSGAVNAEYSLAFGKLSLSNINKTGGTGKCGTSIEKKLQSY